MRAIALLAFVASAASAQTRDVDLGALVLSVSDSWTAQTFHIVDQLSQWDQYAHKAYVRWARKELTLTASDSALLAKHAEMRRARGWGKGFEQAFLVDDPIAVAARNAIDRGTLTADEANAEREILEHFAPILSKLLDEQGQRIVQFRAALDAQRDQLRPIVAKLAHFAGATSVIRVPAFLVVNSEENSGGGEANGGRLVIEVPSPDAVGALLHESLHHFLEPRSAEIRAAADSAHIDYNMMNEGIAYALAPGMTERRPGSDYLAEATVRYVMRGLPPTDAYLRSYAMGLVLRPLLQDALDHGETLADFLPKAVARWREVAPR